MKKNEKELKMYVVYYYLKGEPKQTKTFETRGESVAFRQALELNPDCECYGLEKDHVKYPDRRL